MLLCLVEPPVRFLFLCCCSFLMCIFICRSSLFCFCIFIWFSDSFTMSPALHLGSVKACTSSELYPDYFWLPLLFHLPQALRFWVGIFYPQVFLPYAPSQYFWHNLLLSRLPREPAVIPWNLQGLILILKTQTRPICLFDLQ